jgi:hypothetical protein
MFDLAAIIPAFVTFYNYEYYAFKCARLVNWNSLFNALDIFFENFLFKRTNKWKVKETVNIIAMLFFILFAANILACIWCYLGRLDRWEPEDERMSWVYYPSNNIDPDDLTGIYIWSIYFVF